MNRFLPSAIDTAAAHAGPSGVASIPQVTTCELPAARDGGLLVLPTHLVVLIVVIVCFVGGFAALLRAGYTPTDTVSVLYLAGGAAVDVARRAVGLVRRR
ncbi:hypothetical protein HRW18_33095 [Streptomyces lunaelactis]|uniref:hypothetical protein n=1 Tax=Streptomyces lunaelactis TaxID=1535768 RepID=UPI00158585FB|nr:hypothetical protein [Streptomyces lunaelactis]NUK12722.1 hypothetical protein [Streptomyces lunaelactis]NUK75209.1 hypothetical protein [Streptomyces lunaelactis]NUL14851.1 hypothetical protein [Streptomyces lunaelactis]NUL27633.1 hypothetical protein [Streptomyces lunaelactis]